MEQYMGNRQVHRVDFAVIGGGLAGMLAAIAAARHGSKVVLMQDRPVLGGNCSSEIRMWALGARDAENRESGIMEEILLENMYRNPTRNFSIWDSVLYEKVIQEPNITLLLNCSCVTAQMDDAKIRSVTGWQLTTYTWQTVEAAFFADCSGDSILAELTGAAFRMGREAADEFNESFAVDESDSKTMGMSCLMQARETGRPVRFTPPDWAHVYKDDSAFIHRGHDLRSVTENFWWIELGGEQHSIYNTEEVREELLKVVFGVWDHIKNHGDHGADNWELDWVGFLPGKRESRRYEGDHIITQQDVQSGGRFKDTVAYGGWPMDDHNPKGFATSEPPTTYHTRAAVFGIPYRALYSRNVENLFFAGRNISATHIAMSASRVMATCAVVGQAVGTAASLAIRYGLTPREMYEHKLDQLQQTLMEDDCWLPGFSPVYSRICMSAKLMGTSDVENLRNGINRPQAGMDNGCYIPVGQAITYNLLKETNIRQVRLVFDSDFSRDSCDGHKTLRRYPMLCNKHYEMEDFGFPKILVKAFRVEIKTLEDDWICLVEVLDNRRRSVQIPVGCEAVAIRFIPLKTYGAEKTHIFEFVFD